MVPAFDHIFVIVMENHSASQIIGSADAPFINQLAASHGLAANYRAVSHPSLPASGPVTLAPLRCQYW